jgi:hypothetical protein
MDLIDVEDVIAGTEPGRVEFWLDGLLIDKATVQFSALLPPPGEYGNHTANHFYVQDGTEFDQVFVYLGGSGGIDNVTTTIPEPSAAFLFFAGMAVVGKRIRRSD